MKSLLPKKSLLLCILSTNLYASLPDEINYPPYEDEYTVLSTEVSNLVLKLDQLNDQKAVFLAEESRLENLILYTNEQITNLNQRISDNGESLYQLSLQKEELERKIDKLELRKRKIIEDIRNINSDIAREDRRLQPLRNRLSQISENLNSKKTILRKEMENLGQARKIALGIKSQLDKLIREKTQVEMALRSSEAQLASLDGDIVKAQSDIQNTSKQKGVKEKELQRISNSIVIEEKLLSDFKKKLEERMRADRADPKIPALRKDIAQKTQLIKDRKVKEAELKQSILGLERQEQALSSQLANLEKQKVTLPEAVRRLRGDVNTKNVLISTKQVEFSNADQRRSELDSVVANLKNEIDHIANRLESEQGRYNQESMRLQDLTAQSSDLNNRLDTVISKLNQNINDSQLVASQIISLQEELPNLENQIRANEFELSRSQRELAQVKTKIDLMINQISKLEIDLQGKTIERDDKYSEYLSRFSLYNTKLENSKTYGASQAENATQIARIDSDSYVQARSQFLGKEYGTKLANVRGSYWGVVRAELSGFASGYKKGYSSTEDGERGQVDGKLAGINQARSYAELVLKPRFFEEFFESEIVQNKEKKNFVIKDASPLVAKSNAIELFNIENYSNIMPLSEQEIIESNKLETSLDELITKEKNNSLAITNAVADMSVPRNVYEAPEVPFGEVNCNDVYKQVSDFITACQNAYFDKFESLYLDEYYQNFAGQYQNLFEQYVAKVSSGLLDGIYDASLTKNFPIAENDGLIKGKEAVYNFEFGKARNSAYQSELPIATQDVKLKAKYEVKDWISNNATLTIKDAKLNTNSLKGGDKSNLVLSVKNISPAKLTNPVKILITKTKNAQVESNEFYITSADANSNTIFDKIKFLVPSDVKSNQDVIIGGKLILSGGKYKETRTESFEVKGKTEINPALNANLDYLASPQIVTKFRKRTILHTLNVAMAPSVEDIKLGYKVLIEVENESKGLVQLKNNSFSTGSMGAGLTKNFKFQYTFLIAARGKSVKLNLKYFYNGNLVKLQPIELKPF